MTDVGGSARVRAAAWLFGAAAVLMITGFLVQPVRYLALPGYMLAALGLMALAWAGAEARWIRDRIWVRRAAATAMLLIGIIGVAVVVVVGVSAARLIVSGQGAGWNVLGWAVFYSPIWGAALFIGVAGWRLVQVDQ